MNLATTTDAREQIKEELAQLGIKRGSIFWPVLALLIAVLVLSVYFQDPKQSEMKKFFVAACEGVSGLPRPQAVDGSKDAPQAVRKSATFALQCFARDPASATNVGAIRTTSEIADDFYDLDLFRKWSSLLYLKNVKGNRLIARQARKPGRKSGLNAPTRQQPGTAAGGNASGGQSASQANRQPVAEAGEPAADPGAYNLTNHLWPLFVETAKLYTQEVIKKFGEIISDLIETAGIVALVSLIPGLAGMIYRRNFWGWFTPPFVVLFLGSSGLIGQKTEEGRLLLFLLSQLIIVLLVLRLQRYTRKTGLLTSSVQNWLLALGLFLVAVAWWNSIGGVLWTSWAGFYQYEFIFIGLPLLYSLLRRSDAWNATAPKNIVVCLDGTTNTPDQFESGRLAQTNVFKLFRALKRDPKSAFAAALARPFNATLSKRYADKQIAFYYSGVGNKFEYDPIVQFLGGATGLGAADVVDRAYLDIIRVYRPGDKIFIFGFSRGAAIARLLARAIDQRGAPKTIWTWRLLGRHWTLWKSKQSQVAQVPVAVLGCFDTVGAFGIGKNIAGINFQKLDLFKDLTVPDNVEQAYHMVALDEMREEFSPTLMEPDPMAPARIIEVWFSGDHANIGGGWGTTKLSDLTLDFLLRNISSGYAADGTTKPGEESWGIYLNIANGNALPGSATSVTGSSTVSAAANGADGASANDITTTASAPNAAAATAAHPPTKAGNNPGEPFIIYPDPLGQLRLWRSAVYIYKPRELPQHAVLSETVFQRMAKAVPLYAPKSLFNLHEELNSRRNTISSAVDRLKETRSLTPEEYEAMLGFKDRLHLIRWPQHAETLKHLREPPSTTLANQQ